MKKVSIRLVTLGGSILYLSAVNAAALPSASSPTTFLGPTAKVSFTSPLSDLTAFSVLGEAGFRDFRVGATLAWRLDSNQRFKVSADYLWQEIKYGFITGISDQWKNQGELGIDYEYLFSGYNYNPTLDFSAYISHAPSKTLGAQTGLFKHAGAVVHFVDLRRIAGANGAGIAPGLTVQPWQGGTVGVQVNYDNVRYSKSYSNNDDAKGLGGTLSVNQFVAKNIEIGARAAVRQPFNNYEAKVAWTNVPYHGSWTLGVFGEYMAGKNTLPNTWNAGISADYYLERNPAPMPRANLKGDLKGELAQSPSDDFLAWTSEPAVYTPQVLAVKDEKTIS
jgi:hypothetical protein